MKRLHTTRRWRSVGHTLIAILYFLLFFFRTVLIAFLFFYFKVVFFSALLRSSMFLALAFVWCSFPFWLY